jgi:lipopolysaccharide transport protein LptA
MKYFYSALLFFALLLSATAQLGLTTPGHAGSPKMSRGPIKIQADGPTTFDLNHHWVTYNENVVVTDPQMKLTCEWLQANLPQNGERLTNIVAQTNVIMDFTDEKGQKTRATGDKAVYYFHVENGVTNETVTLTANPPGLPKVVQAQNTMTGDAIIWDRATDAVRISGHFKGAYFPTTNSPAGTNNNPIFK